MTTEDQARFEVLLENIQTHVKVIAEGHVALSERFDRFETHVHERFDRIESELVVVKVELGAVKGEVSSIKGEVASIKVEVASISKRVDRIEKHMNGAAARRAPSKKRSKKR